ncbi:hypothetical protein GCM10009789_54070 [Kribbella sancticallisti]|uniref:DNA binding domain-containing protein, excisionase family n=1 Tax=Kribbella sancticallisti TaxID=460087 RepID=A0ABP4PWC4_9ACTN
MPDQGITIRPPVPGYLTRTQCAAAYETSVDTIKRRTKDGLLTPVRVGRSLLYPVDQLDRVLGEQGRGEAAL